MVHEANSNPWLKSWSTETDWPPTKGFFNACQNYDGQEPKHYLPPPPCSTRKGGGGGGGGGGGVGEALVEGREGTWEGTTPWY